MNKKGSWTLSAVFGSIGGGLTILSLAGALSLWWLLAGIIFIILAFLANK
jgi:hypothetical protein